VDGDFGDTMVSSPQPRNRLKDGRGKDDEMPRGVWKTVETNTGKIGVAETEGERSKGRSEKEKRREYRKTKEVKESKDSRCEESNRRVGDLG